DERDGEFDDFNGIDDALGDDIALHDAAENIDEDRLDVFISNEELERLGDLFLGGATADVEEVGGFAAVELDDVHRRHGEAGAIDHAGNVAVEANVIEVGLGGFDFAGIFLGDVAVSGDVVVAEEGVVVKIQFGIERENF